MFTGIIEGKGVVIENLNQGQTHRLCLSSSFTQLQEGESVAVNGVCLTLLPGQGTQLCFDVSMETLKCTTLGFLKEASTVNLERAMAANSRFGGHYVCGHVDKTAEVASLTTLEEHLHLELKGFTALEQRYLLPKGSITVEGVSLTINEVTASEDELRVQLMLVPHTLAETTLGTLQVGQAVNIEFDYLAKIVAHQLSMTL